jgi:hypothetical protein
LNEINYANKVNYRKQKDIFIEQLLSKNEDVVVITNSVQKYLGIYYNAFDGNAKTILLNFDELKFDSTDTRKKFLFLNTHTRYLSGIDFHELPYYVKYISPLNPLIFEDKELNISIYEMNDLSMLKQDEKELLYTINQFEEERENWKQDKADIIDAIKFNGKKSIKVVEYSATFNYPIDSLDVKGVNQLLISCNLQCYFEDRSNAKLVISIENDDGAYIWKAIEINKYLLSYSNWNQVVYEVMIDKKEIKENSRLKVYLWNVDKQKAFIDDFEIKIVGF